MFYHISFAGTCPEDIRAEQIGEFSSSLNSEDVFILETPSKTWIWTGEASDTQELDAAQGIGNYLGHNKLSSHYSQF